MSGVGWNHRPWAAHTVRQRWARHAIMFLGQHIHSNDAGHNMPSSLLEFTYGGTTSVLACPHVPSVAHTLGRHRVLHVSKALGQHSWSDDIGCVIPSLPLGSIDGRTMSDMTGHNIPWAAHTVRRHRAWLAIITLGKNTR